MLTDAVTGWFRVPSLETSSDGLSPGHSDRRNPEVRERLMTRIRAEFSEMPCLRLTEGQSARLFGLRGDVCGRVLASLEREGTLQRGSDGRFGIRESQ
jgi:hypothetical protein